jgi:hypothetical protein
LRISESVVTWQRQTNMQLFLKIEVKSTSVKQDLKETFENLQSGRIPTM